VLHSLPILSILRAEYRIRSSSLCSFLHPPVTYPSLAPCSSFNVRDQVSHLYRTTGKIIVSYIVIFTFLDSRREDESFWTELCYALPELNLLLISSWIKFWFLTVVPKYLNCATVLSISYDIALHLVTRQQHMLSFPASINYSFCAFLFSDTRWGEFLNLPNPSGRTKPWGLLSL
jgi:hypothetical protein